MFWKFRKEMTKPLPEGTYVCRLEEVRIIVGADGVASYQAILSEPEPVRKRIRYTRNEPDFAEEPIPPAGCDNYGSLD
jgi:transposase-like protein